MSCQIHKKMHADCAKCMKNVMETISYALEDGRLEVIYNRDLEPIYYELAGTNYDANDQGDVIRLSRLLENMDFDPY